MKVKNKSGHKPVFCLLKNLKNTLKTLTQGLFFRILNMYASKWKSERIEILG